MVALTEDALVALAHAGRRAAVVPLMPCLAALLILRSRTGVTLLGLNMQLCRQPEGAVCGACHQV